MFSTENCIQIIDDFYKNNFYSYVNNIFEISISTSDLHYTLFFYFFARYEIDITMYILQVYSK